jgi:hypothetical protein
MRIKNKTNYTSLELKNYNKLLQTRLVDYSDEWQFDKLKEYNKNFILDKFEIQESYMEFWRKISLLKPFFRNILYLKYDFEFNKIRSNKKISELLCCSEENIRYNLRKAVILIK